MPTTDKYVRLAKLVRVIDGDTVELDIDLGFSITIRERVRVLGINTPEMKGATRERGQAARDFTIDWFHDHGVNVVCRTSKDKEDSFGRFLAEITCGADSLGADLLASGNAVPFMVGT